ncbi:hypothetical protein TcasGA2_TC014855 [Tribolium castaneum]|uniref:Retroviral polymerase SH3-like domain-containing protein n=1 Tax=Tribolium castaneum TaxID=7070 RepID=D2A4C7_TRICA|nr:hypothetical protein TcasGA2_TC014855 [Tribolium castaneum]
MSGNSSVSRIELLNKENYDTWKIQMQAVLIKCDLWDYTNGVKVKPEPGEDNQNVADINEWIKNDQKAKSEMILSISSTELRQIKNCVTSREMWCKPKPVDILKERDRGKFDPRAQEGIFLGYAENSKAFRIWSPEKSKVFITRDVKLLKDDEDNEDNFDVFPSPPDPEESSSSREFVDIELLSLQNETPLESTEYDSNIYQRISDEVLTPTQAVGDDDDQQVGTSG